MIIINDSFVTTCHRILKLRKHLAVLITDKLESKQNQEKLKAIILYKKNTPARVQPTHVCEAGTDLTKYWWD